MQRILGVRGFNASLCVLLCLIVFLSACGNKSESKLEEKNSSPTQQATKVESKTLTFYSEDPGGFDPAYAEIMDYAQVGQAIFEGLVKFKKNSTEVEPALATKWEISPDLKIYTFSLRKNVKFHDGTNFNADSVLYSFERQLKDKRKEDMSYASFIFDIVSKIEKKDDYTIQVTLSEPSITFLPNLAMYYGSPIVSSDAHKKDEIAFAEKPVGTGPYKMVKYEKEKSLELEINKEYWGEKPKIDKVIMLLDQKDEPEKLNDLTSGKIDILNLRSQSQTNKLNPDNIKIANYDSAYTFYLSYNSSKPPFNDRNFREGVSHLIDRDKLIKSNLDISGEKAETFIPSNILGFNSKIKGYSYDISKADELLKKFPKNKELSLIISSPSFEHAAKFIVDSLGKNGVKVKTETVTEDVFSERLLSNNYDIVIDAWQSDNGDPDNFMFLLHTSSIEGELNYSKFSNKEFDEMIDKGKKTLNLNERSIIYQKAEEILFKEVPILPLHHSGILYAHSLKLKDFNVHPSGIFMFQYFDKN